MRNRRATHRRGGLLLLTACALALAVGGPGSAAAPAAGLPFDGRTPPECLGQPATLWGSSADDVILGTVFDDVIVGLGGNDTLLGLGGKDRICGGAGNDTLMGSAGADNLLGGLGQDNLSGGLGNDTLAGSGGDDTLAGGDGNDTLKGGPGNDSLLGNEGDDTLQGEDGTDTVTGGPGTDTCFGETKASCELPAPALVLRPNGINDWRFDDPASGVLSGLTALMGAPTNIWYSGLGCYPFSDPEDPDECSQMVTWQGFTAVFGHKGSGPFSGYTLEAAGAPIAAKTPRGIGIGATVTQLEAKYPDGVWEVVFCSGIPGYVWPAGDYTGFRFGASAAAVVNLIVAGLVPAIC